MNKLRDRRGFTLTELLCAVLIVLLVSALLTVGVRFAGHLQQLHAAVRYPGAVLHPLPALSATSCASAAP